MVFSLKQHIPPSGELIFAEVSLVLHRSHGQSKYAVHLSTRRRMYRSSTCVESWRFCPTAFLLRSGEFIPRHPFVIQFSRCNRGCLSPLIPYLGKIQRLTTKKSEKFFQFLENGSLTLAHGLLCHTEMFGNLFFAHRGFGQVQTVDDTVFFFCEGL